MKSTVQIEPLVKRAKALGFHSLALTDEGVLYAAIPFYQACLANGIKPIFGLTIQAHYQEEPLEALVLAKSNEGYRQLIRLSTLLQKDGLDTYEDFLQPTEEWIVILLAKSRKIATYLEQDQFDQLQAFLSEWEGFFPPTNLYIGIERMTARDEGLIKQLEQFSQISPIPIVALHDVRYLEQDEAASYDCLQAMRESRPWSPEAAALGKGQAYLCTAEEMADRFQGYEDWLQRTNDIASKCQVSFSFDRMMIPKFPLAAGQSADGLLESWCHAALKDKYKQAYAEAKERLDYELSIIKQLKFSDYFLIVADFVQYAKDQKIAVGPGRGSAAGSIVAYLLGITDVDPLRYNLIFERFLNPERITMPDIDVDFSDKRREEVIQYVREKYGEAHVAQIITFGSFAARSVLREVMKVMEVDENDQAYILRHIPHDSSIRIRDSIGKEKQLIKYIGQSKKLSLVFKIATQLEGLPRHLSIHAAGIVIGKRPLLEDVPLTKGSHGLVLTQYPMNDLEALGLLKFDILGLKNLSLIERILQSIHKSGSKPISLASIDEQDGKSFALLQAGKTNGVFQFESGGMKQMLMKVKPTSLEDLIALNALYRPGPMEHIGTYTRRKHGLEPITYLHEDLEDILKETYGVLIYQEQIMQIANRFASFSLGEADLLRRAISAKSKSGMEAQRKHFIDGCLANGYSQTIAEQLFRWIVTFANYGFNKSHSVAYSKLAYYMAYLKANYPAHFFAQLLSASLGEEKHKKSSYIREAQSFGLKLLPPSINHSLAYYSIEDGGIRMGLMAIKGIGYDTVEQILAARKDGPFRDLFDFVLRLPLKRKLLENLILAGTFDALYPNRASLLASITPAIERAELFGGYGGASLFEESLEMKPAYVPMEDFSQMQKLADEKELLGIYVSTHPLKEKRPALSRANFASIERLKGLRKNTHCQLVAFLHRLKKIRTRRGDSMAFASLSDETGEMESVIFSNVWRQVNQWLEEDAIYRIQGRVSERNGEKQLIIQSIAAFSLDQLPSARKQTLFIRLQDRNYEEDLAFLSQMAGIYPGNTSIIVYDDYSKESYRLSQAYNLSCSPKCLEQLKAKFGTKNVVLKA